MYYSQKVPSRRSYFGTSAASRISTRVPAPTMRYPRWHHAHIYHAHTHIYVGPQTRTPPVREQGSTVRERVPSVRERVFSTIRSRTAFTRARTDIICARTVIFANGCSPPQHPFVNRYHPFANRHHPLFHQSPELTFTVGCQLFTHRYHPFAHGYM